MKRIKGVFAPVAKPAKVVKPTAKMTKIPKGILASKKVKKIEKSESTASFIKRRNKEKAAKK